MSYNRLKVATAFSGGLAAVEFALRYENIDHEIVFACEWDKFARQQYLEFHSDPKTFYKDIQDLDAKKYYKQIDLFAWGSPCQDLSLAGKRKGFNGAKSSLFREGARVQAEMMPKNFIFENVKGLLSSNKGADYKEVCDTFRNMGYYIVTLQLNTKDYGVPQNRERVFIVGFLDEVEYHNYKAPIPFKLETRLGDILEDEVNEKHFLNKKQCEYILDYKRIISSFTGINNKEAKTLMARYSASMAGTFLCVDVVGQIDNENINNLIFEIKNNLFNFNSNPFFYNNEWLMFRKFTPKECFRLQGVKDEDINLIVSDSQAYKIAGNAISVNVMQYLLKSLYKQDNKKENLFDF